MKNVLHRLQPELWSLAKFPKCKFGKNAKLHFTARENQKEERERAIFVMKFNEAYRETCATDWIYWEI